MAPLASGHGNPEWEDGVGHHWLGRAPWQPPCPHTPPSSLPWSQVPKVRTERQRASPSGPDTRFWAAAPVSGPGAWGWLTWHSSQPPTQGQPPWGQNRSHSGGLGSQDRRGRVAVPGHREELRLKATALQGLEGMNGRGVSPWPPRLVPPGPPS